MDENKNTIFLSYSHKNSKLADYLENTLRYKFKITRDINEAEFKTDWPEFMNKVRKTDFVLMIVSDDSLKSSGCMYELHEMLKDNDYLIRFLPVVIKGTKIYDAMDITDYVRFWNDRYKELNKKVRNLPKEATIYVSEELKLIAYFQNEIGGFLNKLRNTKHIVAKSDSIASEEIDKMMAFMNAIPLQKNKISFRDILNEYEKGLHFFFDDSTGAVKENYRENRKPPFLYTEVTAFAIIDFLLLYSLTGNNNYKDKAEKAFGWIATEAIDPCGGILTRKYISPEDDKENAGDSFSGRRIRSFDTAICVIASTILYQHLKKDSILDQVEKLCDFLVEKMIEPDGRVFAIFDAHQNKKVPDNVKKWSEQTGFFHMKVAEALFRSFLILDDNNKKFEKYRDMSFRISQYFLKQQKDRYYLTSENRIELHPLCYGIDGQLELALLIKQNDPNNELYDQLIKSASKAIGWIFSMHQANQTARLPQIFEITNNNPAEGLGKFRTDSLAQIISIMNKLRNIDKLPTNYDSFLKQLVDEIIKSRKPGEYFNVDLKTSFFYYGFYEESFSGGKEAKTLSYWTNSFCLNAIKDYMLSEILRHTYIIVLAGGIGSRCWPISCQSLPKPFTKSILGNRSLFQETVRRFTKNLLINAKNIYLVVNNEAHAEACNQAENEGIPSNNVINDLETENNIGALNVALEALNRGGNSEDPIIVASMADDMFEPHDFFQYALINALFAANDNDCMISIGKKTDPFKNLDLRFGYMAYDPNQKRSFPVFSVKNFVEKPSGIDKLKNDYQHWAWECGILIFKQNYFKVQIETICRDKTGQLGSDFLQRAFENKPQPLLNMFVSLINDNCKFDDFGVPGQNMRHFYSGTNKDKNVILGSNPDVRPLSSTGNLIISGDLPIHVFGINDLLIIDNSEANTTVVMPLEKVSELENFYKTFETNKRTTAFVKGGNDAKIAEPYHQAVLCHGKPDVNSYYGCAVAYECGSFLMLNRSKSDIKIFNREYLDLSPEDFDNLFDKAKQDPMLVNHLIDVAILANCFMMETEIGRKISPIAKDILQCLCLYHDYGGYLSGEALENEKKIKESFSQISKLKIKSLDSRITMELLKLQSKNKFDESYIHLLNDSVNSAVELLQRKRPFEKSHFRDIILLLLQIQDMPGIFPQYREAFSEKDFGNFRKDELEIIYVLLQISDSITNGRSFWKREQNPEELKIKPLDPEESEDFAETIIYNLKWLNQANIKPNLYIEALNELLLSNSKTFISILKKLNPNLDEPLLLTDRLYILLISNNNNLYNNTLNILNENLEKIKSSHTLKSKVQSFPENIKVVQDGCNVLNDDKIDDVSKAINMFMAQNYNIFSNRGCKPKP